MTCPMSGDKHFPGCGCDDGYDPEDEWPRPGKGWEPVDRPTVGTRRATQVAGPGRVWLWARTRRPQPNLCVLRLGSL